MAYLLMPFRILSYAKNHPNGRSWLTTALFSRIILLCDPFIAAAAVGFLALMV